MNLGGAACSVGRTRNLAVNKVRREIIVMKMWRLSKVPLIAVILTLWCVALSAMPVAFAYVDPTTGSPAPSRVLEGFDPPRQ